MVLTKFLTNEVMIGRLTTVSGDKTRFATMTTSVSAHIQQVSDRKTVELGGAIGKLYKIFFDIGTDIREGDEIIDEGKNRYKVIAGGVRKIDNIGIAQHIEVLCQKVE